MRTKRIMAGLALCLFLFSLTACGAQPQAEIESGEAAGDGMVRYTKTVTVERLYDKDELQSEQTLEALTKTGLFSVDNLEYSLADVVWEPMTITGRYVELTSSNDYGFVTTKPSNAAAEKEVTYNDERSGETITVRLPLVFLGIKGGHDGGERCEIENVVLDNAILGSDADSCDWAWRDDLKIPLKATLTGEYLKFGNLYIPYTPAAPTYLTFETAVLNSLKLDTEKYRITGSHWTDDAKIEDGEEVRYGYFTGERYCADYVAVYEGRLELPDVQGYKATLVYEAFAEKDVQGPVIVAGGSVLVLAIPIVTWLLIARRKKKKENDTDEKV